MDVNVDDDFDRWHWGAVFATCSILKYKPRIAPDQGPVLLVKKGKNRKNCGPSVFEFETRNFDPDHINAKKKILQTIIISPIIKRELVSGKRVQTSGLPISNQ